MKNVIFTKSAEIRSRIEPDLKHESTEVLSSLGLDMSDAIRLFLRQVVEVRGLPFELRQPTPKTVTAMIEAREIDKVRFGSAKELFDELENKTSEGKKRQAAKKGRLRSAIS